MPRSKGAIVGETYQQILTRTLPSTIAAWEKLGFIKDKHYFIGKRPPRKWKWKEPFEAPPSYDHYISVCNGAGVHLVSQDILGSSNGLNISWTVGDEAKYLNRKKYEDETLPTIRADFDKYGHLPFYASETFTTSMPTVADAKWILDMQKQVDPERINLIRGFQYEILRLRNLGDGNISTSKKLAIATEIRKYQKYLAEIQKDCIYYSEFSSVENVAILGENYLRKMKRTMPDFIFETEILNKRPDQIEGGFYPAFNTEVHTYTAFNNSFLQDLDYDIAKISEYSNKQDSRQDADCIKTMPLHVAVDWGSRINCMSVAQWHRAKNELKFIKCLHVLHPEYLDHLAAKFIAYYQHHPCKEVFFAYDHTGNTSMANSDKTYSEQFATLLRRAGWRVYMVSKGKAAPTHQEKYLLWQRLLERKDSRIPVISFNKYNCKELIISMLQAPVRQGPRGIVKDKSSEKNINVPQQEATHYSDTADILVSQLFTSLIRKTPDFVM
jgi:hypothetical protein